MSVARPHSATRAHSVTDEAWFSRWIAQVVNSLEQCILWNAKDITIIGIQVCEASVSLALHTSTHYPPQLICARTGSGCFGQSISAIKINCGNTAIRTQAVNRLQI